MKKITGILSCILVIGLLTACGPAATPTEDCPTPDADHAEICLPEDQSSSTAPPLAIDQQQGPAAPADTAPTDFELRIAVVAWYGIVEASEPPTLSSAATQLRLMNSDNPPILMSGVTSETEVMLMALRDSKPPFNQAHIWGELLCTAPQYDRCRINVRAIQAEGTPPGDPEPITGWLGLIYSGPAAAHSGGDDYFVLIGPFHAQFGLQGIDADTQAQIEALRDSGTAVVISGELLSGVPDWHGTQIIVSQINTTPLTPDNLDPLVTWPLPPTWTNE